MAARRRSKVRGQVSSSHPSGGTGRSLDDPVIRDDPYHASCIIFET